MTSSSQKFQDHGGLHPPRGKLHVTLLASEWRSAKGDLSTIGRELAIELAKFPEVKITYFVPQCSDEDKRTALSHHIEIVEATRLSGYDELEWLIFPPDDLQIDVIVGHGVKLGRQAQVIRRSHKCKWIQVVHTDPEELGMYKSCENPISTGEKKHKVEVELCEKADFVVGVGPKLCEAFRRYLRWCKKDETILDLTPGVFDEFVNVEHASEERERCGILVFGCGDAEDFQLKGFDVAGKAVAELSEDAHLVLIGAPEGNVEDIAKRLLGCGLPAHRLRVRSFLQSREDLKQLLCEVDLLLMPSRTEGFGLEGLEALSAGLPVLVSKNSGFGEALHKMPLGSACVIDSEDSLVWTEAIKKVWKKDRKTRLQEAEILRYIYKKEYSWAKQSEDLVKKMENIVNQGGKSARKTHRTNSFNSADVIKDVVETSHTDPTTFIERQRQTWVPFSEEEQQEEKSQTQLNEMEQRVRRMQEQLREKEDELEISQRLREQQLTNFLEQQRHLHEQLRQKDQKEENLERHLREIQEELREKDQHKEIVQRQLGEIQEQLREKDQQEENLQRQLREIREQLREKDQQEKSARRQLREIEDETDNLQEQVTALERQLRLKDQQVNESQITLSTALQALDEHQRGQVTRDWVISRDQIQLTDKLLGRGSWGRVVEGKYCGCSVAVKQIHELILSPHNRSLFEREMAIASVCRHPCLLLFIGATNDEGSPLFVTELMESSLRALLEQKHLVETEVSTFSLDVARALNYLHQKKPSPIIHRDISSANVLLWRQGEQWRGKVSDYGTANFMQHTMTVGSGSVIYMAPEALTSYQTVKVDVYSFGVLLCEMCIQELPDPERRDQQIAMVTNRLLRALIRRCLQSDPVARPNMENIIEELEEPV